MTVQKKIWISGLMLAALSLAPTADAQQKLKTAVADDIFADHPSMDRNATVMPAADGSARRRLEVRAERQRVRQQ